MWSNLRRLRVFPWTASKRAMAAAIVLICAFTSASSAEADPVVYLFSGDLVYIGGPDPIGLKGAHFSIMTVIDDGSVPTVSGSLARYTQGKTTLTLSNAADSGINGTYNAVSENLVVRSQSDYYAQLWLDSSFQIGGSTWYGGGEGGLAVANFPVGFFASTFPLLPTFNNSDVTHSNTVLYGTHPNYTSFVIVNFEASGKTISGNTETGSSVAVTPSVTLPGGTTATISLTFDNVENAGETTVTASAQGPPPPSGFKLTNPPVYYEISTTATFSGSVRVCLSWTEGQISNESRVQMFHYEGNQWVDITDPTSRDTVNNTVCGTTTSFSPFTLMEIKYPFTGFLQPVDNLPTVNAVKAGAAVPVKFSLGGDLGLNIFASGYPKAQLMQCVTGETIATVEETVNAGGSSLSYDVLTGIYTYVWKTDKGWANSCRELQLMLNDGEVYSARFTMRK